MLQMRHIQAIRRPTRRTNRRQSQRGNNIARRPVVLVNLLRIVHATIYLWYEVLREPYKRLDVYENIERETKTCVWGLEVFVAGARFVHLDDYEAGGEGGGAEDVEKEVGEGAGAFLGGGVGGLEDEGGLDGEEEASLFGISSDYEERG